MRAKRKPTRDAVEILHRLFYEGRPDRLADLEVARAEDEIARQLRALRKQARLSQRELAKRARTKATVINDLEEADYEGNSLEMLCRIAAALRKEVEIRVVNPKRKKLPA